MVICQDPEADVLSRCFLLSGKSQHHQHLCGSFWQPSWKKSTELLLIAIHFLIFYYRILLWNLDDLFHFTLKPRLALDMRKRDGYQGKQINEGGKVAMAPVAVQTVCQLHLCIHQIETMNHTPWYSKRHLIAALSLSLCINWVSFYRANVSPILHTNLTLMSFTHTCVSEFQMIAKVVTHSCPSSLWHDVHSFFSVVCSWQFFNGLWCQGRHHFKVFCLLEGKIMLIWSEVKQ